MPLLLAAAKVDAVVFVLGAALVLAGAIGVIMARNPVHSALMLVMTLFGVAVLFVAQEAHFLAAVQVIVYAGAIVVLFLFVIMLVGVDKEENVEVEPLRGQRIAAIVLGIAVLGQVLWLGGRTWTSGSPSQAGSSLGAGTNVEKLARSIFTRYLLPFEATSVLLVVAVVGAVVLARRPQKGDAPEVEEPAAEDTPAEAEEVSS
ncbi:MAG: NADH-quinone oxidoreductase subunit J [Actinobacteria bacterium]|nr:NADH-quinone oxidoreductase subunit J [Actinomycetota bacterium]MBV9935148.1 NADH-quinone oxidoreductase subunit J [Actinomycetota bacterium]